MSPFDIKCKNFCEKPQEIYLRASRRMFFIFSSNHGGCAPDTFWNSCESCYNAQLKPFVTYKIESFVTENGQWLETVVDCYYIEVHLKFGRAPRSDCEMHKFRLRQ